jgi:DNA invertase Pin-like site-specific DNA recombinase
MTPRRRSCGCQIGSSGRDWHQLLEICALFDTLIADADGVYDPANYNDRRLLGLKATMSEAELHILKARMLEGRRAKARRRELGKALPMCYLRRPSGEVVFDPDEQAQATIRSRTRSMRNLEHFPPDVDRTPYPAC